MIQSWFCLSQIHFSYYHFSYSSNHFDEFSQFAKKFSAKEFPEEFSHVEDSPIFFCKSWKSLFVVFTVAHFWLQSKSSEFFFSDLRWKLFSKYILIRSSAHFTQKILFFEFRHLLASNHKNDLSCPWLFSNFLPLIFRFLCLSYDNLWIIRIPFFGCQRSDVRFVNWINLFFRDSWIFLRLFVRFFVRLLSMTKHTKNTTKKLDKNCKNRIFEERRNSWFYRSRN